MNRHALNTQSQTGVWDAYSPVRARHSRSNARIGRCGLVGLAARAPIWTSGAHAARSPASTLHGSSRSERLDRRQKMLIF
jgi:hypothetical protein